MAEPSRNPLNVLVLAQTPPPIHGQSAMTQYLLEGKYERICLHHVRMAFSETISEVGVFKWKKIVHILSIVPRVIWLRIRTGATVLYYPPAGPKVNAFYRDAALLLALGWMFRYKVFHFYAAGISELYPRLSSFKQWIFRRTYFHADCGICLFSAGLKDAEFVRSKTSLVVPCGIPDEAGAAVTERHIPTDIPVITFLAMLSEEKGVFVFLEACAEVIRRGEIIKPILVGWPESEAFETELRHRIMNLGLEGLLERHGRTVGEEKFSIYLRTQIFCFPTHYPSEGSPVVLLEAMQFGLPIIATRWRGCEDLLEDGKTGILVPTKDSTAVADHIVSLIRNKDLRTRMGKAARERYEQFFSVQQFRNRMEDVFVATANTRQV